MPSSMPGRILIIAGEASGALYAQRLLEAWRDQNRSVDAFGIGSKAMESLGFLRIGKSEELAVVGLVEVIKHYPDIRRVFYGLLSECDRNPPQVALLIDYPDFNLRLAKELKKRGIKVVYYISPQLWAWRKGRIELIKKYVDKMLVVFPFEKEFYEKHGVDVDFVGHPLLDELPKSDMTVALREKMGISANEVVLGLMPGSRESEIKNHLDAQIKAVAELQKLMDSKQLKQKTLRPVLLCAPSLPRERFAEAIGQNDFPIQIVRMDPVSMISLCDFILVASGTATLLVGLLQKPMVIMYRMNAVTAWLAKRLVKGTPFFGMPNLISGREIVVELFQEQASPQNMASELFKYVTDDVRANKSNELFELRTKLGSKGATHRVAEVLEKFMSPKDPR